MTAPHVIARHDAESSAQSSWWTSVNPIARLGAAFAIALCLVLTIDWVSAATALALELALLPFLGIRPAQFWRRTWPVWLAAPLTGLTIVLYGETSGRVWFEFLFARVSDGSISLGVATMLRVLAIALPSVVLFIGVDTTRLADGLAQIVRLPARFVLGALAGLRLVGLLVEDWRSLELARRARGVGDTGRLRRLAGQAFSLLVIAIRRGSRLATAMEARAFGSSKERSWARPSKLGSREVTVMLLGFLVGILSIASSLLAGTWNFIAS
ncbi:energy-coupling factor transporter transmembrane component T family protein [Ruicaihuangia caeni]|uniref:energy-coupling factor transporter transmembrane component T family protein n=1 Tax=Ruicaihuangia caeni TaxID=3042517 RepID=UPI00338F0ED7